MHIPCLPPPLTYLTSYFKLRFILISSFLISIVHYCFTHYLFSCLYPSGPMSIYCTLIGLDITILLDIFVHFVISWTFLFCPHSFIEDSFHTCELKPNLWQINEVENVRPLLIHFVNVNKMLFNCTIHF